MTQQRAEPPVGGTRAYLQSLLPSLVPSERRVAQLFVTAPDEVAQMSVSELAQRTETSPATVVRACKRLGFDGFQHLRQFLLRDLGAAAWGTANGHEEQTGEPGSTEHFVTGIFSRAAGEIRTALAALDYAEFEAAAQAIRACRRLFIVGNGASLPPAQSIALRFLTSGLVCEAPADIVSQQVAAKLLTPDDVCLAVSDSGMNMFTLRSARVAAEQGATVIGVTSYAKSALAAVSTHTLVAGAEFHTWNDDTMIGNIVQMLLLSALQVAATSDSPEAAAAHAEVFREVLTMVEDEDAPSTPLAPTRPPESSTAQPRGFAST
ncbi:MurR/RpiR family transcriptional regulator [Sinomonas sp. ASV322]|uniref:MurR/RpiR family transcriptional regulator n=1 Tax=Sinomonas sp. ASV322 TaxID=3041920 RepID=UPI0027DD7EEA|nr:MurR/RpiR family transcriptional regulator [Sinomonas sp. ASV322]MDQ4501470.1 MurR/RpiR family transcriptional regulator [Sinomonas sp. ASV322]